MSSTPVVMSPEKMNSAFADAFNSGNVENMLALYEPNASHIIRDEVSVGLDAIRVALLNLLQIKGHLVSINQYTHISGEIALLRAKFHLVGVGPDGKHVEIRGATAEVVRRQADGRWLYVVDHASGGEE